MIEKHKLTIEMLENSEPGILFKGEIMDCPLGFYINGTGKMLKYVVIRRGGIAEWCIYAEDCYRDMDYEEIKRVGNKIFASTARAVIDASEEVWKRYAG